MDVVDPESSKRRSDVIGCRGTAHREAELFLVYSDLQAKSQVQRTAKAATRNVPFISFNATIPVLAGGGHCVRALRAFATAT